MRTHIFLLPLAVGVSYALTAQQLSPAVVASGGGFDRTETRSLEWTLGQLATHTLGLPQGMLTQGFHQPNLQVVPHDPVGRNGEVLPLIEVYPNPAQTTLNVSITGEGSESYSVLQLLDARGRTVVERLNASYQPSRQLDLAPLPAGTYHLRVAQPDGELTQTFTVLKLK